MLFCSQRYCVNGDPCLRHVNLELGEGVEPQQKLEEKIDLAINPDRLARLPTAASPQYSYATPPSPNQADAVGTLWVAYWEMTPH